MVELVPADVRGSFPFRSRELLVLVLFTLYPSGAFGNRGLERNGEACLPPCQGCNLGTREL